MSILSNTICVKPSHALMPKCSGCGKNIPMIGRAPTQFIFCKTCTDHIRKGGPTFFTTYSFKQNDSTSNNNTDI